MESGACIWIGLERRSSLEFSIQNNSPLYSILIESVVDHPLRSRYGFHLSFLLKSSLDCINGR